MWGVTVVCSCSQACSESPSSKRAIKRKGSSTTEHSFQGQATLPVLETWMNV